MTSFLPLAALISGHTELYVVFGFAAYFGSKYLIMTSGCTPENKKKLYNLNAYFGAGYLLLVLILSALGV